MKQISEATASAVLESIANSIHVDMAKSREYGVECEPTDYADYEVGMALAKECGMVEDYKQLFVEPDTHEEEQ